jgi:8-amino-7-oxononanoate synthase
MERIVNFLEKRRSSGLLRTLKPASGRSAGLIVKDGREFVDFCSNDYLSLSFHPELIDAHTKACRKHGTSSSASRLLSGDLQLHHQLEEKTAKFKQKEAAVVFNSGYQANLGIISALCGRGDAVFCDRLSHASIIDGIKLSGAKLFRFEHNSTDHLENLLEKNRDKFENSLIITESLFSMDGDTAPLSDIVKLKERYDCLMMTDEAHATGIFGDTASGIAEKQKVADKIELIMGTFSKALGGFGGYLACSGEIKEYLINTARSFIYSTALPASVIASNLKSLELVKTEPYRRTELLEKSDFLRNELLKKGLDVKGNSQIIPVSIPDAELCRKVSVELRGKGFYVLPILYPTVAQNQSRLRFSVNYAHSNAQLQELIDALSVIAK